MHTNTYTYIYTYTNTHTNIYTYTYCTCIYTSIHTHLRYYYLKILKAMFSIPSDNLDSFINTTSTSMRVVGGGCGGG